MDPSPSYLSWPSTQGGSFFGSPWVLCPLGSTQQYQVFINSENFGIGGVSSPLIATLSRDSANTTTSSLQVLPRTPALASPATLPPSTPTPGSRRAALLPTTLSLILAKAQSKVAPPATTREAGKRPAARVTTRGQAALFKESHACSLLSYIPSVIAPYRSFMFSKLYFRSN